MVCGHIAGGLELEFVRSNVRVQPIEGWTREASRSQYQEAEFDLSERAGLVIQENALDAEPVLVKIGGNVAHRMVYSDDALTFRQDLARDTIARLKLLDAVKVLGRGVISKNWSAAPVVDIMEYLLSRRDDPYDVITSVRIVDEDLKNGMEGKIIGTEGGFGRLGTIEIVYDNFTFGFSEPVTSADFKDMSPLAGLETLLGRFETNAWVDPDGVLIIGPDPSWGEVLSITRGEDIEKLAKYTVTEAANPTQSIKATGNWRKRIAGVNQTLIDLNAEAVAERTDVVAGASRSAGEVAVDNLSDLENILTLALIRTAMEETNGTVEFDGYALDDDEQAQVARVRPGDHIIINAAVPNLCDADTTFTGGHLLINSITQRWNAREGWRIILDVAEIPEQGAIDVRSWYYNPRTGERYEDDDIYTGTSETNQQVIDFFDEALADAFGVLFD